MDKGFSITKCKGFAIQFENGYRVSVQFGIYNYCDNYILNHADDIGLRKWETNKYGDVECANAEVAVFDPDGDLMQLFGEEGEEAQEVAGYYTPKQLLELLAEVASFESKSASNDDTQLEGV